MIERRNMDRQIKRPLLSNDSNEDEDTKNPTKRKLYNYWQRRKEAWTRKRNASKSCRLGFNCLILVWSVLALITTVLSYFRLVQLLKNGHDKLRFGIEKKELNTTANTLLESGNLASIGAYLIMTSLILSIMLVFSFVCLPFDSDKKRLRHKLKKWLCVYFGFILIVSLSSILGVALVLIHDEAKNHQILCINEIPQYFEQSCYFQNYERIIWSSTLVITPLVILAYHVYFWKNVFLIYNAIDLSKSIIKSDVWFYEI